MESCERAYLSAKITGFSAATSILAASRTALGSPAGGVLRVNFGIESFFSSSGKSGISCSRPSATITTGAVGGVTARA